MGLTVSSKIMLWSAACEKTRSKLYDLLFKALAPINRSMTLPLTPSVLTMTALFSLTSRSLRPRHRTTTLMLVASAPPTTESADDADASKSRSLRLIPVAAVVVVVVARDDTDSDGDTAPERATWAGTWWWRAADGRVEGGLRLLALEVG